MDFDHFSAPNGLKLSHEIRKMESTYGVSISEEAYAFTIKLLTEYKKENIDPIKLMENAMLIVLDSYNKEWRDSEEDIYCLNRAYIEACELRRALCVCHEDALSHAEKELEAYTCKLQMFIKKWSPVLEHQQQVLSKRSEILAQLNTCLTLLSQLCNGLGDFPNSGVFIDLPSQFNQYINELEQSVHTFFKERRVVRTSEIVQAARKVIDLPIVLPSFEDLKSNMCSKLIGLDILVDRIGRAVSLSKPRSAPLLSFLMLGPHGRGRSKLAHTLAEAIYGEKDRFLRVDVSENSLDWLAVKMNGCVLMFDKVENATHVFINQILPQILKDGIFFYEKEKCAIFSNDIILVSSHQNEVFPLDFDDVLHFPFLTYVEHMAIYRLQVREFAKEMTQQYKKPVFFYPSDAAIVSMMGLANKDVVEMLPSSYTEQRGAHVLFDRHKICINPILNRVVQTNYKNEICIVYIDQAFTLGKEFDFRVEDAKYLMKDRDRKKFIECFSKLNVKYFKENVDINRIYKLKEKCKSVCDLIRNHRDAHLAIEESKDSARLIEHLLLEEPQQDIWKTSLLKTYQDTVAGRLYHSLELQDEATVTIVEALLKQLKIASDKQSSSGLPIVLLCLGLNDIGKNQLTRQLQELLMMNNGERLIGEVDLSCTNSCFRCLLPLTKVKSSCVVLLYNLEKAHRSVYNDVLSILDFGILEDTEGNIISFDSFVFVIVSTIRSLGSIADSVKERMGPRPNVLLESSSLDECIGDSEQAELRCDLLDRVECLLLFDWLDSQPLARCLSTPMSEVRGSPGAYWNLLSVIKDDNY